MIIAIAAVGILIGIAVIGILAAIAIPNLQNATNRSKQRRTVADMRSIATAIEAYAVDNDKHYPDAANIDQLAPKISPTYILQMPARDGWGNPYRYQCWNSSGSGACDTYALVSAGKDGYFEAEEPSKYSERAETTNFNSDIVFRNGEFIQYPQGVQAR